MTFAPIFRPVAPTLSPLQQAIIKHCDRGAIKYFSFGNPEINAPLESVANAVESAYILTAKDELPKVTEQLNFVDVEGFGALALRSDTPGHARKRATAWLAVARHLEAKEKAKANEDAKAKAVAAAAATTARVARLDEIAHLWFGKGFSDLGPNRAAVIKEIYRLETIIAEEDAA